MEEPRMGRYGGKLRTLTPRVCQCGQTYWVPAYREQTFCSLACCNKRRGHLVTLTCAYCHVEFQRPEGKVRTALSFCGRNCLARAREIDSGVLKVRRYGQGITRYRTRAFRAHGKRCAVCGYEADERMLDVDHIDGDRKNHAITNLQVLCVWDHACKTRLGAVGLSARAGRSSK